MLSGRSFINIRKRTGPNTALWGTPEVKGTLDEVTLLTYYYTLSSVGKKRCNASVNVSPNSIPSYQVCIRACYGALYQMPCKNQVRWDQFAFFSQDTHLYKQKAAKQWLTCVWF